MDNKLYMVSLGPGDIDLVTIKALFTLKDSNAICIPTKSIDNSFAKSLTYKIVSSLMEKHNFKIKIIPIYTPMHYKHEDWQYQVDTLLETLDKYKNVSFVTLGDASIYSSIYYLLDIIQIQSPQTYRNCEVIAGVTSFCHASAKIKRPICIGDSSFSVVPFMDKTIPNTTIYMRPKIGMDTSNININGTFFTFEDLNYKNETISKFKIKTVTKYMTLFIDFFKKV